ncbi:ABC-type glutathione transport system ATPase component [Halomicronema hongdechloris C2206]|uniref:ABC-type glutathione transport system ATPase component n=1 Tax=Halomicronema hongdechloris C2206 TaxID=1641165 RepID=A0A1Z3HRH9_9CYAN|nr:ABC transporter ATP-binding protein [Halomicronema hongdechloris]ASC72920.1 ABC-type glutathione transport system ATPase component [Halomicronema hongdechloris C2206]
MSDPILDVRNLQVHFQVDDWQIKAVDGISFHVNRGQTLGIVGESGSGKSVTSLAIMGLVPSPPGKILNGELWFHPDNAPAIDLTPLPERQRQSYRGGQISMIFQEPMSSLNPVYTCGFQLTEAIRQHQQVPQAVAEQQAIARLQEVELLPDDESLLAQLHQSYPGLSQQQYHQALGQQKQAILNRYPHQLSGGQIQRVMIAMAIACDPSLLIADEPTTALDVTVQARILELLRDLRDRRGMSMIFITHDLGIIAEIADQVAVMYQGQIVEYGSIWTIFSNPQHPYTKGLLACRPQPHRQLRYLPTIADFMEVVPDNGSLQIREKPLDAARVSQLNASVTPTEAASRVAQLEAKGPLLTVENLQVGYPVKGVFGQTHRYVMAVNQVSFQIYQGETFGLVGESGCGKTTLGRALLRLIPAMGGRIWFQGKDVLTLGAQSLRRLRRDMQIIFQDPFGSLDPRMSIGAAVAEPLNIHGVVRNVRHRRQRVAYLLERVGLPADCMDRYPHEFSGGQRQRICIARALGLNPKFIICDESVSSLDVSVQAQALNLLKELQAEFNLTYIFISHDLSVVKFMSDRIMVMNQGRVEEIGPAEQIYRQPQQPYTQQLIKAIPMGNLERIQELQAMRSAS